MFDFKRHFPPTVHNLAPIFTVASDDIDVRFAADYKKARLDTPRQ